MTLGGEESCLDPGFFPARSPVPSAGSPVEYIAAINETRRFSTHCRATSHSLSRPRARRGHDTPKVRLARLPHSASGIPRVVALGPSSLARGRAGPTLLLEPAYGTQPAPVTRALCREVGVAALHTAGHTTTIRQKLGKARSIGASVRQEGGGEVCPALPHTWNLRPMNSSLSSSLGLNLRRHVGQYATTWSRRVE